MITSPKNCLFLGKTEKNNKLKSTLLSHATQRQQYLANNKFSFYRKAKDFLQQW